MVVMQNVNAKGLELPDETTKFLFVWIPSLVAKLLVVFATQDFVNPAGNTVCNGDFRLICRTKSVSEFVVFGSVKRASLEFCVLCNLNQDQCEMGISLSSL